MTSPREKMPSSPADTLEVLAEKFYQRMQVRNFAASTIKLRREYLGRFLTWLDERGITEIDEVTRAVLLSYQRYLFHFRSRRTGSALKFSTQLSRLVAVRAWFRFLLREQLVASNPASDMDFPKEEQRLPSHVLSTAEVERVLNQPDVASPFGLRDRAMLEVFYSTAMRRSELIHLSIYDVDTEREVILIRQGKGAKDRYVPIGKRALRWLVKYQQDIRPAWVERTNTDVLFVSCHGRPFGPSNLSILVREYMTSAGITSGGSCHQFRHAASTHMLENGADILCLQSLLGHAEITTTQIYAHVSIKHLQEIHRATHPADLPPVEGGDRALEDEPASTYSESGESSNADEVA